MSQKIKTNLRQSIVTVVLSGWLVTNVQAMPWSYVYGPDDVCSLEKNIDTAPLPLKVEKTSKSPPPWGGMLIEPAEPTFLQTLGQTLAWFVGWR